MSDTPRRLLLRLTLKLLTLTALLTLGYLLLSASSDGEKIPRQSATLRIDLATVPLSRPQRTDWEGGTLQLLRMVPEGTAYLFYDRGGDLGCPLAWYPAKNREAPQQPWPGGFRDQCSGVWYHYDGHPVEEGSSRSPLQGPPYRLLPGNLLEVGISGDNAAPASRTEQ